MTAARWLFYGVFAALATIIAILPWHNSYIGLINGVGAVWGLFGFIHWHLETSRGWKTAAACCLAVAMLFCIIAPAFSIERSPQARADFKRLSPCPSTGQTRGACPGWEIDHVIPLKCKGADRPENMQWLTVEQHRAKTSAEARICRK